MICVGIFIFFINVLMISAKHKEIELNIQRCVGEMELICKWDGEGIYHSKRVWNCVRIKMIRFGENSILDLIKSFPNLHMVNIVDLKEGTDITEMCTKVLRNDDVVVIVQGHVCDVSLLNINYY